MTICDQRMQELAEALASARLDGTLIAHPADDLTLADAYTIQEEVTRRIGGPLVGWKVGSTSAEAQARLGTDEPGAGRLLRRFCYSNGDRIPVHAAHHLCVEVEFAFALGRRLAPRRRPYSGSEVRDQVAAFLPAMEIVGSRFRAGLAGSGRCLVTADGGANVAFARGAERALPEALDLRAHRCRLHVNGAPAATGEGARALGDPMQVLAWLANHLSGRGLGLDAGAIVSTGTCTGLVPVGPGDRLRADFGRLGEVSVTLVDPPALPR